MVLIAVAVVVMLAFSFIAMPISAYRSYTESSSVQTSVIVENAAGYAFEYHGPVTVATSRQSRFADVLKPVLFIGLGGVIVYNVMRRKKALKADDSGQGNDFSG
jgi:hypothetical protein